jgi:hypothetical protein
LILLGETKCIYQMHFSIFQKTIFNLNHLVSKNVHLLILSNQATKKKETNILTAENGGLLGLLLFISNSIVFVLLVWTLYGIL